MYENEKIVSLHSLGALSATTQFDNVTMLMMQFYERGRPVQLLT